MSWPPRQFAEVVVDLIWLARRFALAPLIVLLTTAGLFPFRDALVRSDVALVFLTVVAIAALFNAAWPSTVAAVLAFMCFNFFFIPPYYTFSVDARHHILALFVFLGIAVMTSQLVSRIRIRTGEAMRRGRQTETLHELSIALISEVTRADTLNAIVVRVREVFALDTAAILIDDGGDLLPQAISGESIDFQSRNLLAVARWVLDHRQSAGFNRNQLRVRLPGPPGAARRSSMHGTNQDRYLLLLPIATSQRSLGVLVVSRDRRSGQFDDEQVHMLDTFANQSAIAIERSLLTEEHTNARILVRSDELKSALLSAVSHDLRTPLASIKTSATSLLQEDISWTEEDRRELLTAIDEEVDRMDRLVTNLLDLSRIEAGAMRLVVDWYEPVDVIRTAIERTESLLADHRLIVDVPDELPLVQFDYVKIVQVLFNLLQNAAKYSPDRSEITLLARVKGHELEVAVRDEGIGIQMTDLEQIFDKFYRVEDPSRPLGAGVGLAICRGFIEAHGGRIWAERNPDRGMTLRFRLPFHERAPTDLPRPAMYEYVGS